MSDLTLAKPGDNSGYIWDVHWLLARKSEPMFVCMGVKNMVIELRALTHLKGIFRVPQGMESRTSKG